GAKLAGGVEFGAAAAGMPEPEQSFAPPAPITYNLPHPSGPAYGSTAIVAPPAPDGFTAVRYADTVAFVPTKAGAAPPDDPPAGYVAWTHPELGTTYIPARYVTGGVRAPGMTFGVTADGMPAPAVPLARACR